MAIEAHRNHSGRESGRRRKGHLTLVPPPPRTVEGAIGQMTNPRAPHTEVKQEPKRHLTLLEQRDILEQPVVLGDRIEKVTTNLALIPRHPSVQIEGEELYASPFPKEAEERAQAVKTFIADHPGEISAVGAAGLEGLSWFAQMQAKVLSSAPPITSFTDLFSSGGPLQWIEELAHKGLWEIGGQAAHVGALVLATIAVIDFGIKIFRHFFPAHQEKSIEE